MKKNFPLIVVLFYFINFICSSVILKQVIPAASCFNNKNYENKIKFYFRNNNLNRIINRQKAEIENDLINNLKNKSKHFKLNFKSKYSSDFFFRKTF